MANVCVITGGGSGMGLEAAKFMPKDKIIVLTGRTMSKLEKGVGELKELGYEAYATTCDTSKQASPGIRSGWSIYNQHSKNHLFASAGSCRLYEFT